MYKKSSQGGWTFIEIMIVSAILVVVVAAIVLQSKKRVSQSDMTLKEIQKLECPDGVSEVKGGEVFIRVKVGRQSPKSYRRYVILMEDFCGAESLQDLIK
jgi:hypothetical protein